MGTLNRIPRGLLSLLDSQVQGQNPSSVGEQIVPTLDVSHLLADSKGQEIETISVSSITTNGLISTMTPPVGQYWLLHAVSAEIIALDATATTWFPSVYLGLTNLIMPIAETPIGLSTGVATYRGSVSRYFDQPLGLSAPENLNFFIQRFTGSAPAAGVTTNLYAFITRLSV